jgi:ribosomal protein S18 acetylase RimI-like enzyme
VPITYRPYIKTDKDNIRQLFETVFHRVYTPTKWDGFYGAGLPITPAVQMAFDGEQLMAHVAAVSLSFTCEGDAVRACRMQDGMVHPDYRGRGMYPAIVEHLTEQLAANAIDLVVNFPNDGALPTFTRKLNYQYLAQIPTYSLLTRDLNPKTNTSLRLEISPFMQCSDQDQLCIQESLKAYKVFNNRPSAYMNWRFSASMQKPYFVLRAFDGSEQIAVIIFKYYAETQSVDLLDVFVASDTSLIEVLLGAIVSFYAEKQDIVQSINAWLMPHYAFYECFEQIGFRASERLTHLTVKALSANASSCIDTIENYYLSMSDSDVY